MSACAWVLLLLMPLLQHGKGLLKLHNCNWDSCTPTRRTDGTGEGTHDFAHEMVTVLCTARTLPQSIAAGLPAAALVHLPWTAVSVGNLMNAGMYAIVFPVLPALFLHFLLFYFFLDTGRWGEG